MLEINDNMFVSGLSLDNPM